MSMRNGAPYVVSLGSRRRPPPGSAVMRQASWLFQGRFRDRRAQSGQILRLYCTATPPRAVPSPGKHCDTGCWQIHCRGKSASRARPGGACELPPHHRQANCRPRRVAAPGDADRTNRAGVFADATPTEELRDVMVPNAPGLRTNSFFPHSTASPAGRSKAALAARLGVLPQCRSACLSTPPTPRKPE